MLLSEGKDNKVVYILIGLVFVFLSFIFYRFNRIARFVTHEKVRTNNALKRSNLTYTHKKSRKRVDDIKK